MDKVKIIKYIIGAFAASGSAIVVNNVISDYAHPKSLKQKLAVICSRVVITALVGDAVRKQTDKMIDEFIDNKNQALTGWAKFKKELGDAIN